MEEKNDFLEHVRELRKRIVYSLVGLLPFAIFSFILSNIFIEALISNFYKDAKNFELIGTAPQEAFILKIKIAFFGGLIISMPWVLLQIWIFISPGLKKSEKKMFIPFILITSLLFFIGAFFCYSQVLPFAFEFFMKQYSSINLTPNIKLSEHISLALKALFGFGIIFELPVIAFFLAKLSIISSDFLKKYFKHAVVSSFVLSAFLTPPDIITQFLMAVPLMVLYGISILVVKFAEKKN